MNKSWIVNMLECAGHFEEKSPYLIFCNYLPPLLDSTVTHITDSISASKFKQIIIKISFLA